MKKVQTLSNYTDKYFDEVMMLIFAKNYLYLHTYFRQWWKYLTPKVAL